MKTITITISGDNSPVVLKIEAEKASYCEGDNKITLGKVISLSFEQAGSLDYIQHSEEEYKNFIENWRGNYVRVCKERDDWQTANAETARERDKYRERFRKASIDNNKMYNDLETQILSEVELSNRAKEKVRSLEEQIESMQKEAYLSRTKLVKGMRKEFEYVSERWKNEGKNKFYNGGMFTVLRLAKEFDLIEFEHDIA